MAVETPLGPDVLLLTALTGVEELSRPFDFVLDLQSEDRGVNVDALVGQPACVTLVTPSGGTRYIHGLVRRVREVGGGTVLASYQAELVPWLWMLSLSADCRIFQQRSVPEVVAQVFADLGHADYELRLARTYPKREYCVQYRETHLDFVSRLLEDEGIAYHFAHTADRHVLVLTDGPAGTRPCPGAETLTPERMAAARAPWTGDTYSALTVDRTLRTRAVALADYDYLHPSVSLTTASTGDDGLGESFDYPGGYAALHEGDRYARLRLEAADAQRETAEGESGAAVLTPGYRMTFAGNGPGADGRRWLVTRVTHSARQAGYVAAETGADDEFTYTNRFLLASSDLPWRPVRSTVRPRVAGTQSALVVGRSGEEIWTDAHGRVKLHFYWDRHGKRDENSSCWVRCTSAWAGRGYGQFSVPRMGQEVLVDFLEGDPDRPVVVGRVFNADQPPPCDPGSARGVVSGIKTQTHKGQGSNGIEMNDTAGKEHLGVHAQYDMSTDVGHDDAQTVANNRKITVGAKHTETIASDTSITVSGGAYSLNVAGGTSTVHVSGAVKENFDATQETTVAGKITVASHAGIEISAATEIKISVGSASLLMKADGTITLDGVNITVDGRNVEVKGSSKASVAVAGQSLTLTPSAAELAGAMVKSAAQAVNEITGATVKLN